MSPTSSDPSIATKVLDAAAVARGADLLHAQCWLWGQDLHSPSGDLMQLIGLDRRALEGARSHRTYYAAAIEGRRYSCAWSGGFVFGCAWGALFFPRLRFAPIVLNDVRSLDDLPDLNSVKIDASPLGQLDTRAVGLIVEAVEWLAAYEDSVHRLAGPAWRRECARRWGEIEEGARAAAASVGVRYEPLRPLPKGGLAEAWRELGRALATIVM